MKDGMRFVDWQMKDGMRFVVTCILWSLQDLFERYLDPKFKDA